MTHQYDFTTDDISRKIGNGAREIQQIKAAILERILIDHNCSGVLSVSATQDGTHKKITMPALVTAPSVLADAAILYVRTVDGNDELCYLNDTDGEILLTENGRPHTLYTPEKIIYTGSSTIPVTTSYVLLTFPTESEDVNGSFAASVYTSLNGGTYLITVTLTTTDDTVCAIYINGVVAGYSTGNGYSDSTFVVSLSTSDYFDIRAKSRDGGAVSITTRSITVLKISG